MGCVLILGKATVNELARFHRSVVMPASDTCSAQNQAVATCVNAASAYGVK